MRAYIVTWKADYGDRQTTRFYATDFAAATKDALTAIRLVDGKNEEEVEVIAVEQA